MIQNRIDDGDLVPARPARSGAAAGAIRKTRLPVILNDPTWMMTDSVIEDEQAAEDDDEQLGAGDDRQAREGAAERERAGVAHEDLGRRGVPPQEAEAGTHHAGGDDGQVVRVAHLVALEARVDLAVLVVLPDADEDVGAEDHHARRRSPARRGRR